jgi:hypothetical protein
MVKLIISLSLLVAISTPALAQSRRNQIIINTLGGKVQYQNPYVRDQDSLKGVGTEFIGEARVSKEGQVTVFISGCKNIDLGNQNDETLDTAQVSKLKSIKNGDSIKIRMNRYGSCEVGDWKKN